VTSSVAVFEAASNSIW